jgi:hypothetical protein
LIDEKYLFILCIKFCADLVICDVFVVLLWLLAAACIKSGRPQIAKRAIELVEQPSTNGVTATNQPSNVHLVKKLGRVEKFDTRVYIVCKIGSTH